MSAGILLNSPLVDSESCCKVGNWNALGVTRYQPVDLSRIEAPAHPSKGSNFGLLRATWFNLQEGTNAFSLVHEVRIVAQHLHLLTYLFLDGSPGFSGV
jgi:hypothetical protein